jgi:Carboxypeptidase regulatory-like domain
LSTVILYGQSDRGTITGAISDSSGAVVPSAPIEAKNVETGAVYRAAGSSTGNYTLTQLPTGTYEITVAVPGFKSYVRQNLVLPVAQTLRIDVALEVGTASESVTVSEVSPLLKTESGELSHNVATDTMNNLPVLGIGSGASSAGIRNPYAVLQLLPGSDWRPDTSIRLNGMPSNTEAMRIEGQDATNGLYSTQSQTSVDAIQGIHQADAAALQRSCRTGGCLPGSPSILDRAKPIPEGDLNPKSRRECCRIPLVARRYPDRSWPDSARMPDRSGRCGNTCPREVSSAITSWSGRVTEPYFIGPDETMKTEALTASSSDSASPAPTGTTSS